jgi:hypothetical protein
MRAQSTLSTRADQLTTPVEEFLRRTIPAPIPERSNYRG